MLKLMCAAAALGSAAITECQKEPKANLGTRSRLPSRIFDRRLDDYDNPPRRTPRHYRFPLRISAMSDLVCIAFQGRHTADQVLNDLRSMQKEHLVDLEDSCIVTRDEEGKLHLKQAVNLVGTGALSGGTWGALWGTLVGLLFLNPLAGLLIGAAAGAGAGALSGALADYGIDDDFIKSLGEQIGPDTSALFVLLRKVTIDKVLPELGRYQGQVMKTSLSNEQEQKLRDAISHHAATTTAAAV